MNEPILGIHHVTAIAGDPQANLDFYAGVLGLRLVKVTVNFDDPGTYHFYYGDASGNPGSILSFFPYAGGERGRIGAGQVAAVSLGVPAGSFGFWNERLSGAGVRSALEDGPALSFADPDGLALRLVEANLSIADAWQGSPVPAERAITRIAGIEILEQSAVGTIALLENEMGYVREPGGQRHVLDDSFVEVQTDSTARMGRVAVGSIHHVAFRVADDPAQIKWHGHLADRGFHVSPVMDRDYFHSIYFREPGGVLFELATDSPGFTIDEPFESLGTRLQLPGWLEHQRSHIEEALPKISVLGEAIAR